MLLNYFLALLSGLLLVLIHPGPNLTLLAPLAITPLVYALDREWSPRQRFGLGYVTGIVFWAGVNHWIHFVISFHGGMGDAAGAGVFALFCLLKGLHLGLFGLLGGVLMQHRYALVTVPALWVAVERMPSWFSYTWLTLGNAGIDMGLPLRLAPFTGVYGLSFLFAMFGTAIALVLLRRPRRELVFLVLPLGLLVLPALPEAKPAEHEAVSVQPNVAEQPEWSRAQADALHLKLEQLSLQSALAPGRPNARLILWPEMPAPNYYLQDAPFRERVNRLAQLARANILLGSVTETATGAPLNSAVMVSSRGNFAERYSKTFLVPFGEYVPWPFGGIARKVANEIGDFARGNRVVVFPSFNGAKVSTFICYESAFPDWVRRFPAEGATLLTNLSNDGYFGKSAARAQHLSLVRMRAVENRRWILRSTNDGTTASIDSAGRLVKVLPPYSETAGRLPYSTETALTFYTQYGDLFAWSCAVFAIAALLLTQVPIFRNSA